MADVVISVDRGDWSRWLLDVRQNGVIWCVGDRPPVAPGDRLYVVCNGSVRCYGMVECRPDVAPEQRISPEPELYAHVEMSYDGWGVHVEPLVGVTVGEYIRDIDEWVERWWNRDAECPIGLET